ncbi:PAS domain-containing protein [Dongia mobilis]|uniref:PAS domain-containing protein n=1 Tax=Dongia mobilis TaxID=578943 RepID=A0A4R6WR83_9PROT|nr:PAS domain-containing protein [Dongia mobilis]TDQ81961.1 PAS domain-containing protein [Dongia mobilis]
MTTNLHSAVPVLVSVPTPAPESTRLDALQKKWQEDRGARAFPPLAAIDPIALRPFLGDLVVVCVSDPARPQFRLFGSGFREFFGLDCSGMAVLDSPFPEREAMAAAYARVALSGRPELGRYCWRSQTGCTYQSDYVILPYGDGDKVARLLVLEDLDEARRARRRAMGCLLT